MSSHSFVLEAPITPPLAQRLAKNEVAADSDDEDDDDQQWTDEAWNRWNNGEWDEAPDEGDEAQDGAPDAKDEAADEGDEGDEAPYAKDEVADEEEAPDVQEAASAQATPSALLEELKQDMLAVVKKELKAELQEQGLAVKREAAPWAAKNKREAIGERGHLMQNAREQVRPGTAWVTDAGEKVWTSAETGETYQSLYYCYQ